MKKILKSKRSTSDCTHAEVLGGVITHCGRKALFTAVTDVLGSEHQIVVAACYHHYPRITEQIRDKFLAQFSNFSRVRLGCIHISHAEDYTEQLPMAA